MKRIIKRDLEELVFDRHLRLYLARHKDLINSRESLQVDFGMRRMNIMKKIKDLAEYIEHTLNTVEIDENMRHMELMAKMHKDKEFGNE